MSSANKWLIVSGLGFLVTVNIGWNAYSRSRNEALAHKLIAEFHQRYNSSEPSDATEYGPMIAERMQRERARFGRFSGVRQCVVKRVAEPPWLEAKCSSSFENGGAEEFFIMHHGADDTHLLLYSVKSDSAEFSIP